MGPVPHRIFCSWHVDKAMRQNLNKIIGPQCKEKQSTVYKSLKILQTITSETDLKKILNKFFIETMNDPETKDFGLYFERMYANRATLWAYCYRKGLEINCNMNLESIHKTIKYHYLNGCKIGRLDKSIMTIRRVKYAICIHTFECTCLDYSIKSILCKHIHTIALSQENATNKMISSELNDINKHVKDTNDTKEI